MEKQWPIMEKQNLSSSETLERELKFNSKLWNLSTFRAEKKKKLLPVSYFCLIYSIFIIRWYQLTMLFDQMYFIE